MKTQRIWITGASRGIGFETAKLLASAGNKIVLSSRNGSKKIDNQILARYPNSEFMKCDVSKSEQVAETYGKIMKKMKGLDVLINNAGIILYNNLIESTEEEFDQTMSINFKGSYLTIKSVLPEMISQKRGLIINISSVAALSRFTGSSIYSASKSALLTMSRILRDEVRKFGIKVVDILPGATDTDMWDKESRKLLGKKMMKPEDIAQVIYDTIEMNKLNRIITEELIIRPIGGDL
jgi:3-oxoacyl-[acyl-carrier protein] reductase